MVLVLMLAILSNFCFAYDLSGRWDCKLSNLSEADPPTMKKTERIVLNIGSDGRRYLREGDFLWEYISYPSLVIHTRTTEEGELAITGQNIKFLPLGGEVKVLDSGPLSPKELEQELLEHLLADENWVIKEYSVQKVTFEKLDEGYVDNCTRVDF